MSRALTLVEGVAPASPRNQDAGDRNHDTDEADREQDRPQTAPERYGKQRVSWIARMTRKRNAPQKLSVPCSRSGSNAEEQCSETDAITMRRRMAALSRRYDVCGPATTPDEGR